MDEPLYTLMNKDLIVGIAVAIAGHLVVLFGFNDIGDSDVNKSVAVDDGPPETMDVFILPPPPQEPDEVFDIPDTDDADPQPKGPPRPDTNTSVGPVDVNPGPVIGPTPEINPDSIIITGRIYDTPYRPGSPDGDGPGTMVVDLSGLDDIPTAIAQPAPQYPPQLRRAKIEGDVNILFIVGPDGRVRSVEVINSPHNELATAAVKAVRKWRFQPGTRLGQAVSFRMTVPISFALRES